MSENVQYMNTLLWYTCSIWWKEWFRVCHFYSSDGWSFRWLIYKPDTEMYINVTFFICTCLTMTALHAKENLDICFKFGLCISIDRGFTCVCRLLWCVYMYLTERNTAHRGTNVRGYQPGKKYLAMLYVLYVFAPIVSLTRRELKGCLPGSRC